MITPSVGGIDLSPFSKKKVCGMNVMVNTSCWAWTFSILFVAIILYRIIAGLLMLGEVLGSDISEAVYEPWTAPPSDDYCYENELSCGYAGAVDM